MTKNENRAFFDIIIVGGGASGIFAAINAKQLQPSLKVLVLEKSNKLLAKVKISGGGRCNVTHDAPYNSKLLKAYPRGSSFLKKPVQQFTVADTINWFEKRGVRLKIERDGRMFPITDSSQTIIDCFLREAQKFGVEIMMQTGLIQFKKENEQFRVETTKGEFFCHKLLISTGGFNKISSYDFIARSTNHRIVEPVPSLFTFNIKDQRLHQLAGLSVPNANVRIESTKFEYNGPLLITHWGLSGPAVLKLSAFAAEDLHKLDYQFAVQVRWSADFSEDFLRTHLTAFKNANPKKKIINYPLFELPTRLWELLLERSLENMDKIWADIASKELNKLIENLFRCRFEVSGKTTFKEEFVSCGGVDTSEIDQNTMESKLVPGLYFAGEVLNIDGITGGFNFQAAWTGAFVAAKAMVDRR